MPMTTVGIKPMRVMPISLFPLILLALCLITGNARSAGLTSNIDDSGFTQLQLLGEKLFFDTSLSTPSGQSCASCHNPANAFTDPNKSSPTSAGVNPKLFGNRNAPTAMYMAYSPALHYDTADQTYVGGQFWDGRASSLEDQARQPLLNPLEMANPSKASVIDSIRSGPNAVLFASVFGADVFLAPDAAYDDLVQALASFERTKVFAPFSSKYDAYVAGKATLTSAELQGLHLFEDPTKGNCSACHISTPSADGTPALFTDFTYDNIGIPKNPNNPFYTLPAEYNPDGSAVVDIGLGKTTGDPDTNGQFKVGTLRDISLTGPYGHSGYFDTLQRNDGTIHTKFHPDCNRVENGVQTTRNPEFAKIVPVSALGCEEQFRMGNYRYDDDLRARRFPLVDEERGLVLAYGFIDHSGRIDEYQLTDGRTVKSPVRRPHSFYISELFKIDHGMIEQIEANFITVPYRMPSPWPDDGGTLRCGFLPV